MLQTGTEAYEEEKIDGMTLCCEPWQTTFIKMSSSSGMSAVQMLKRSDPNKRANEYTAAHEPDPTAKSETGPSMSAKSVTKDLHTASDVHRTQGSVMEMSK